MAVSAKAVANRLLARAREGGKTIDPLQMEKLVFLAEGYTLATNSGDSLFLDPIEAWKHGPVVPELYFALRQYGADPITGDLFEYDYDAREEVRAIGAFSEVEGEVVDAVWDAYGSWTGPQLIKLTHEPDGPWDKARKRGGNRERNPRILRDDMLDWCFRKLAGTVTVTA